MSGQMPGSGAIRVGALLLGVALLAVLGACSRPLSPNETAFAHAFFGESLKAEKVRVHAGLGLLPPPAPPAPPDEAEAKPMPPPEGICRRVPQPRRVIAWPAAFVLWNDIFLSRRIYRPDTFAGWPRSVPLPALVMAHELVHVWQWQNRRRTHYDPLRPAGEALAKTDPYYWPEHEAGSFFSFGFEEQAAMIEDYVCYELFEPRAPEVREIEKILAPVFDLGRFHAWLGR